MIDVQRGILAGGKEGAVRVQWRVAGLAIVCLMVLQSPVERWGLGGGERERGRERGDREEGRESCAGKSIAAERWMWLRPGRRELKILHCESCTLDWCLIL